MTTEQLKGILDYYSPSLSDSGTGVRGNPSTVPLQSRMPDSSFILTNTANLDVPLTLPSLKTTSCTLKYIVKGCGCSRHIFPSTCMSLTCPTCAPYVHQRRKDSIRTRIETYRLRPGFRWTHRSLLYTVFTIPMQIRNKFLDSKEIQKVRKKIWKVLKTNYGALFGVEATHPFGESEEVFHPHLNFLWMQVEGNAPFIDVSRLRQEWADILGVSVADAWHQYSNKPYMVAHWSKYISKVYPGYHKWTGPIRWYGKYPKNTKVPETLCADCGQPYKTIGFISAQDVSDYYARGWLLGLDPPWYDNKKLTLLKGKHGKRDRPNETDNRGNVCLQGEFL